MHANSTLARPHPPRIEAAAFVLALRSRGIADLAILRAMETVPRDVFAPRRFADLSRQDVALPLPCGEAMTAPSTVGAMLVALGVRPGQRVLEVGSGSGYVTALLAALGAEVISCERRPTLAESAAHRLRAAGLARAVRLDCVDPIADGGDERVDLILVNGFVPAIPTGLTGRLAVNGRLVCGLGDGSAPPRLATVTRAADGHLEISVGAGLRLSRMMVNGRAPSETEA